MIMHKQIIDLFTNPQKTITNGLFYSGYKWEGEYKSWYENGQLWEHCFFNKNGNMEGEYKSWYKNGKLYRHYLYKNGEIVKDYLE